MTFLILQSVAVTTAAMGRTTNAATVAAMSSVLLDLDLHVEEQTMADIDHTAIH